MLKKIFRHYVIWKWKTNELHRYYVNVSYEMFSMNGGKNNKNYSNSLFKLKKKLIWYTTSMTNT